MNRSIDLSRATLPVPNLISRSPLRRGFPFLVLALALAFFALSPAAQAVDPPPDGGYPRANTGEGTDALFSLASGRGNTATGFDALYNNTTGDHNTASGARVLLANITGNGNTAVGWAALTSNSIGFANTASGAGALYYNTDGTYNTASGYNALWRNMANYNTANGALALLNNTTGIYNMAVGALALYSNITGGENTASGARALQSNRVGNFNTATGFDALVHNLNGNSNTGTGYSALWLNGSGHDNTAEGFNALYNATGSFNIAVGSNAGFNLGSGNNNIYIGNAGVAGDSNTIRIGEEGTHDSTFIAGIRGATTANSDAVPVVIDSAGQLATVSSSRRFKDEIKPMDKTSETILGLKPVTFHYKSDTRDTPQFGLIAEEVAKVDPDLVVCDAAGDIYTVRYEAVNAMLLNEFLKAHRKLEEQQAAIAQQQKQIEALAATVQKVSDQIALSKPAP